MGKIDSNLDCFKGIEKITIISGDTGETKTYTKEYLNKLKWINIIKNEGIIDTEELDKDLNIMVYEADLTCFLKGKTINSFVAYCEDINKIGICINENLSNHEKYSLIKTHILKILSDECNIKICYTV